MNPIFSTMDKIKLQHFRNLVSLSIADGRIDETERKALTEIATEQHIPLDRLELMLKYAHEYVYLIPQNQEARETQLQEMIKLAHADGDFSEAERELIHIVGEKLGFTRQETEELMNV